jgi:cysteinyl-tRNA synthetase
MALTVFNTLGNRKEPFVPVSPGKVRAYVCGVTVYDLCHIGHARANVAFDIIVRYLRYRGYQVTYVRNFTDIDDKIIRRADRENTDYRTISTRYIEAFYEDFDRMGLVRPDAEPRATEHIPDIIGLIGRLIAAEKAYVVGGDVYYSVRRFGEYGKLSGKNTEELLAGARVEVDERKQDPLDFALWKASKAGEPSWDSPWGPGRPGWHIECSAMAMRHLGETFDIHGGGKDLVFPHHENEIAQSEGATGKQFARYWIHNGFVNIDNEKMSKSLGNFFTLRDVLATVNPDVLRFFFASSHYRSPIDYSDRSLAEAKAGLTRLYRVKEKAEACASAGHEASSVPEGDDFVPLRDAPARFVEAMDDDFNTAAALGHLFDAVRALNRLAPADPASEKEKAGQFLAGYAILEPPFEVLGLLRSSAEEYFQSVVPVVVSEPIGVLDSAKSSLAPASTAIGDHVGGRLSKEEILRRIEERAAARSRKDFAEADRIRKELDASGVQLEDSKAGTTWKYKT